MYSYVQLLQIPRVVQQNDEKWKIIICNKSNYLPTPAIHEKLGEKCRQR